MIGNGYLSARASRVADTIKLRPTADVAASVATGSGRGTRVQGVRAPINRDRALVGRRTWVHRHLLVRVIDDVPLDARVDRPPIDSDIGVTAGAPRFCLGELRGDRSQRRDSLAAPPFEAGASKEVARVVPSGAEGRNA